MAGRRIARLNAQLQREITSLLRGQVKDPRIGDVIVTGVETTPDLSYARIFVNVAGDEARQREALEGLGAAAPFIRTELGRTLRIRRVPELRFELDRSFDYAMRIERLLREVRPADEAEAADGDAGGADEAPTGPDVDDADASDEPGDAERREPR